MSHIEHLSSEGLSIPSVSQIPSIFAKTAAEMAKDEYRDSTMDGFENWICKGLHTKDEKCCTKAARDYYQEAANLGHDVHALREAFLKGESFSDGVPEYQAAVFDPVAKFYKESGYKPMFIETQMTGKTFGGTLDGAGTFSVPFWEKQRSTFWEGGKFKDLPTTQDIWVEDLKIKSKLDITHPLQLYGYSLLLKECHGVDVKYGLIIRREKKLDRKPEIQLRGYYLPDYKEWWDSAMVCWKNLNG